MTLRTAINTPAIEAEICDAFRDSSEVGACHDAAIDLVFEHGQWWVTCRACGAQYSACDAEPDAYVFEQVTVGEENYHD